MQPSPSPAEYARACVEALVQGRAIPEAPADGFYGRLAACFVSIHRRGGDLRGCIGTLEPCEPTLGAEIARNACAAAFRDPRFYPVGAAELADLDYSVDVLGAIEPTTLDQLDPRRYGVVVSAGSRRGVLLPDLPTVRTVRDQVAIALQKAGIAPSERFDVGRFTVERYAEGAGGAESRDSDATRGSAESDGRTEAQNGTEAGL